MIAGNSLLRRGAQRVLDLIYPPQCLLCAQRVLEEGALCGACWRDTPFITGLVCDLCGVALPGEDPGWPVHCDDCLARAGRGWVQGRAAMAYNGKARQLVLSLKHGDMPRLAAPAARYMAQAGQALLRPGRVLVPVPLHWSRILARRYSQSALLSAQLALLTGLRHLPQALQRQRRTPMLDGAGRSQREEILAGAIRPHPRWGAALAGADVLLIDDVLTSGATLEAAARAAHQAGAASVRVLVLARVAKPR